MRRTDLPRASTYDPKSIEVVVKPVVARATSARIKKESLFAIYGDIPR
jgi:hypothetical protein